MKLYRLAVEIFLFGYFFGTNAKLINGNYSVSSEGSFETQTVPRLPSSSVSGITTTELRNESDFERKQVVVRQTTNESGEKIELQDENERNASFATLVSGKSLDRSINSLSSLTVDLTERNSLLLNANSRQEIYFEITNNLNSPQRVQFTVKDEMRILLEIDKYSTVLGPHETTTVRVAILPRSGIGSDRITFLATGSEQVRKEVIVDIDKNYRSDDDYPDMDYTYSSDCTDVLLSKCEHGTWTIKVSARDSNSGLMILTSIPKGLYFPDGYTAGTKEEVTGYYSESCCKPELQLIAIDRMNNMIVKQTNAYRAPLSFWAITAIVLVSLVILVVIASTVFICMKRCNSKEEDGFDLPTYRGMGTRM